MPKIALWTQSKRTLNALWMHFEHTQKICPRYPQVIITSSGDEKAELSQKILDVLYATEVRILTMYALYTIYTVYYSVYTIQFTPITLTFKPFYYGTWYLPEERQEWFIPPQNLTNHVLQLFALDWKLNISGWFCNSRRVRNTRRVLRNDHGSLGLYSNALSYMYLYIYMLIKWLTRYQK